jgi:deoxyhypusine synthase
MVHIVVCTGALMAHGLSEALGVNHFRHDPRFSDEDLYSRGYNRVHDTIELESGLCNSEDVICEILEENNSSCPLSSFSFHNLLGKKLVSMGQSTSVLGSAYLHNVPVYVPAFTDSGMGLTISAYKAKNFQSSTPTLDYLNSEAPSFNPFLDLHDYALRLLKSERIGIFTVGGGVPRNWAQQIGPYTEMLNYYARDDLRIPQFNYGVRVCPEPEFLGGLSGCTYSEGISWGKFVSPHQGGQFAEVHCDATIAWPILVKALMEDE